MAIVACVAAVATAAWVMFDVPSGGVTRIDASTQIDAVAATSVVSGQSGPRPVDLTQPAPATQVVVDVAGGVAQPGVYSLPAGARVADALAAAGGALPGVDLSSLNLARVLIDGEQIPVGIAGDPNGSRGSGGSAGPAGAPIDINHATAQTLDELPGVGPVLAQSILQWRTEHGRFDSVDQLREVPGIGDAKYAQLRGRVRV